MGAAPRWFVCALGLPAGTKAAQVEALARGMAPLAAEHGVQLVGGNVTRASALSVTLTAAGEVPRGEALLRSGGRPGHALYVSGTLGDARLGLQEKGTGSISARAGAAASRKSSLSPYLRQRRPQPRIALGLVARSHASAAIDLSDGLAQDLRHLCTSSKVGAEVDVASLPVSRALRGVAGDRAWQWALAGGEDYELLLAVPHPQCAAFERACARAGEQICRIGRLTAGTALHFVLAGADVREPSGFDHFR
jgi:thiamine-monophosphate kinase